LCTASKPGNPKKKKPNFKKKIKMGHELICVLHPSLCVRGGGGGVCGMGEGRVNGEEVGGLRGLRERERTLVSV